MAVANVSIGDPTRASWANNVADTIADLEAQIGAISSSGGLPNGSFELDNDTDLEPDGWTVTDFSGGSHSIETSDRVGGTNSMSFTTTVGGGYVEMITTEFLEGGNVGGSLNAWWKTDTSGVRIRVQVLEYNTTFTLISTTTWIDKSPTNTGEWFWLQEDRFPVEGPYYKVKVIIGESGGTTGGTVLLDQIEFNPKNTVITLSSNPLYLDRDNYEEIVGYVYVDDYQDSSTLTFYIPWKVRSSSASSSSADLFLEIGSTAISDRFVIHQLDTFSGSGTKTISLDVSTRGLNGWVAINAVTKRDDSNDPPNFNLYCNWHFDTYDLRLFPPTLTYP
jgi:hypothetical protein